MLNPSSKAINKTLPFVERLKWTADNLHVRSCQELARPPVDRQIVISKSFPPCSFTLNLLRHSAILQEVSCFRRSVTTIL